MLNKAKKVLIAKDTTRDAGCTAGGELYIAGGTGYGAHALEGEVLVLDKNKKILTPGATVADTDTIFLAQATGTTFAFSDGAGTAITGFRKFIFSDPIEGRLVKSYKGKSYTAKSEQATSIDGSTTLIVTAGTVLVLRLIYRDLQDQKGGGQFVHSYRYTCPSPAVSITQTLTNFAVVVNAHAGRRVVASMNGTALVLTGLPIPSCTTGLNDIDKFVMVEFDAVLSYVASDGDFMETAAVAPAVTAAVYGNGTWELVRDAEREALGNKGITNLTNWPVIQPELTTVKSETYDTIIIEHDKSYVSSDNQYTKQAPLKTILFIAPNAAGPASSQEGNILASLNPWMASLPAAFPNVVL
jgi:hypothetical protein